MKVEISNFQANNAYFQSSRTKWYTDKMVQTKWYGLDFTNKIINQYINSIPIDNVILTSILLPL